MSENTTSPEQLVRTVRFAVTRDAVVPTPIDPTLTNPGEAADAYATGQAIAGVIGNLRVNTKAPSNNAITLYGTDIAVSDASGAQTIAAALESIGDRDASDITYDSTEMVTVKGALDDIYDGLDEDFTATEVADILDDVYGGDD